MAAVVTISLHDPHRAQFHASFPQCPRALAIPPGHVVVVDQVSCHSCGCGWNDLWFVVEGTAMADCWCLCGGFCGALLDPAMAVGKPCQLPLVSDFGARLAGLHETPPRQALAGQLPVEGGVVGVFSRTLSLSLLQRADGTGSS